MKSSFLWVCVSLSWFLPTFLPTARADWPAFRGPQGQGVSTEGPFPTSWSATENVSWKTKLPRPGNGSPIVTGDAVFVTSAEDEQGLRRSLYCLDRLNGSQRWVRTVTLDRELPTHKTNPYGGSTPATDGQHVVVWHATGGLHCYDLQGEPVWSRDLGEFQHIWGYGTSPILHDGRVILHTGPGKRNLIVAVDLQNGQTLWEWEEPYEGDGNYNENKKYMGSWSTPVVTTVDGQPQVICMLPKRVLALNPTDGKLIWSCQGIRGDKGDLAYSSPIIAGDICVALGGFGGPGLAVRLGGRGDITESHRLWRTERNPQSIGSGVYIGNHIYRPNAGPGTIDCLEPATGEIIWSERAKGANYWASIVAGGGLLYALNQNGQTIVFRPSPEKFDLVGVSELGEPSNSTPALADGQVMIRTDEHLFCIGAQRGRK